jgi:hypothetical protein
VALVDVPGHPRLRERIRKLFARRARNVVYVIDSKSFSAQSKENAEYDSPTSSLCGSIGTL